MAASFAKESQILIAESAVSVQPEHTSKLRIVAPFTMRIQWQVIGKQVDVMGQKQGKAPFHPSDNAAVVSAPEQPMVHDNGVGFPFNRRLDQRQTCRYTRHEACNPGFALDLQAIGPIVLETVWLQPVVEGCKQCVAFRISHGELFEFGAFKCELSVAFRDNRDMKRVWILFSQAVTVALAVYFVVSTLKPAWVMQPAAGTIGSVSILQAPVPAPVPAADGTFRAAAKRAAPAVVSINTSKAARTGPHGADPWFRFFFGDQDNQAQAGLGSGVIVSPNGYILTNNHVVEGADEIEVVLNDSRTVRARIVGTDPDTDLALLKIELERLPVIVIGNSDQLQVGDQVLAIGNPFGVGQTVTGGIVSALGRSQLGINTFENFIQTDAAINPGNSGGALVDTSGNLMGINTAIYSRSGGSMGIGFAIPVSTARMVMDSIIRDGQVTRGWIGVEPADLSAEVAEAFGVKATQGVIITGVMQNGPAAKAGLRPGDVIEGVAGHPVTSVGELLTRVAALKPGVSARFDVDRRGQKVGLDIVPGVRPRPREQRQR